MDERVPLAPKSKTRAEYRAEFRALLEESRRLLDEMDQNHAEMERRRAEFERVSARTDANLHALQEQLEGLRRWGSANAQRTDRLRKEPG